MLQVLSFLLKSHVLCVVGGVAHPFCDGQEKEVQPDLSRRCSFLVIVDRSRLRLADTPCGARAAQGLLSSQAHFACAVSVITSLIMSA